MKTTILNLKRKKPVQLPKSFPDTGLLDLQDRKIFLEGQKYLDLDYSLFTHDAITLDNLQSRSVSLRSKITAEACVWILQIFLTLFFGQQPIRVLYSLRTLERLSTAVDESDYFEEKRNVSFVEPGQFDRNYFDITVL